MTTQELFLAMSDDDKDKFKDNLLDFGLIHDLNPNMWNRTLKHHIKKSKGKLKKLYQSFRTLKHDERNRFFNAFLTAE